MTPLEILTANANATRLADATYEDMTLKTRDDSSALMDQKDFCFKSKLYTASSQYDWDVIRRINSGSQSNIDLRCLMKQHLNDYDGIEQWLAHGHIPGTVDERGGAAGSVAQAGSISISAATSSSGPGERMTARSITFSSSRTLPGQE